MPALAFCGCLQHRHECPVPAVPSLTLLRSSHKKPLREGRSSGAATTHFWSRGLLSVLDICYQSCTLIIVFFKPNPREGPADSQTISHPSRPLLTHRPRCGPSALQGKTPQRCRGGSAAASLMRTTLIPFSEASAVLLPPHAAKKGDVIVLKTKRAAVTSRGGLCGG